MGEEVEVGVILPHPPPPPLPLSALPFFSSTLLLLTLLFDCHDELEASKSANHLASDQLTTVGALFKECAQTHAGLSPPPPSSCEYKCGEHSRQDKEGCGLFHGLQCILWDHVHLRNKTFCINLIINILGGIWLFYETWYRTLIWWCYILKTLVT